MGLGNAPAQGTMALLVVTALIGALIGVFGKRAAEALSDALIKPFKFIWEAIYRRIAPRNPFSISLHSYKKHVRRSWLTKIENPVGPELDVPLEHAFAPLKLISSSSQETVDLFAHVAASDRCIVLGGPGTGKTTLMKSLVTSVINEQANDELNSLIPVFVVLRRLAVKQQSVRDAIIAAFSDYHFPGAERFVDSALDQGRMLIILDGLDEVGVNREFVAGQIITFCESDDQQLHQNRLIVTCREYSYRSEDLGSVIKNIVRVEPFANHHMRVFLQGWPAHRGRSALQLYGLIQGDSQIRDICRNPLLLTILTGLYLETNDFEFPSSRNLFYKAAIDELIIKRPARREIKQKYEADDKWQILQRASLDRLETVQNNEDPEELTSDSIRKQTAEVFHKEIDFNEFIKELVEVNGIIKPSSDGVYTCAHRTIQEYLAANEAARIRTPKEVILRFSARQDLIEVLYFYCGMISNIPQLTKIIESLVSEGRWMEVGRCLLNINEMPSASHVEIVTSELTKQIVSGSEFKPALEILSSLAQRPQAEFYSARIRFSEAVNHLAGGNEAAGASALESALATSPDAAMKIIPALLKHESQIWQTAAVQLLKDIGTDEALDKLVQLLAINNAFIKTKAAAALAGIIKSRNSDLRERVSLVPDREDKIIWPLEKLFPGKLAIPIAESLVNESSSGNEAIDCAIRAIRITSEKNYGSGKIFLKSWRNIPRDSRIRAFRIGSGKALVVTGLIIPVVMMLTLNLLGNWCHRHEKMGVLEITQMRLHVVDLKLLEAVKKAAIELTSEMEQNYPANASGISRLLPWNWIVEPVMPADSVETYELLKSYSVRTLDPYQLSRQEQKLTAINTLSSHEKVQALRQSITSLTASLSSLSSNSYILLPQAFTGSLVFFFIFISMTLLLPWFLKKRVKFSRIHRSRGLTLFLRYRGIPFATVGAVEYLMFMSLSAKTVLIISIGGATMIFCFVIGLITQRLQWPKNSLLVVASEVLPLRELNDRHSWEST